MQLFFSPTQLTHDPKKEISDGKLVDAVEIPKRAEMIFEALTALSQIERASLQDFGVDPIARVHDSAYIEFLAEFGILWAKEGRTGEGFPFVWPGRDFRTDRVPNHLDGKLGHYSFDAGTPLTDKTYGAAYASAQSALNGASALMLGDQSSFALCRPPGHHAGKDYYGGYCFSTMLRSRRNICAIRARSVSRSSMSIIITAMAPSLSFMIGRMCSFCRCMRTRWRNILTF